MSNKAHTQAFFHSHFLSEKHNSLMNDCDIVIIDHLWVTSPSLYQLSYQPDGIFEPNQSQPFLHTHMHGHIGDHSLVMNDHSLFKLLGGFGGQVVSALAFHL